jgi:hypothetical protein
MQVSGILLRRIRELFINFSIEYKYSLSLQMCCAWLIVETLNVSSCERKRMIHYVSNIISSFILVIRFVIIIQMV